ncbi:FixH family protein [Moraxella equi]|uniref:Uncharacterized protein conserved in bacteria n=1 Tax=Moraxella equi TaxID=60442 RepID=A0A378QRD9_9GAMM|nr:FixH family protein [Moraxella equi]OPH37423.1 hypothetical protein B5J93_08240 [Moraxella equi]STZ03022.1 Uncharacterized protein conserved in bacteria [Moraxella equi]
MSATAPTPNAPQTTANINANVWYKNYMVIVFVIGLPLIVVISCVFFIVHAFKIKDSPVRDDWYMDGKSLYQDASKDKLAHDLGLSGVMRLDGTPDDYAVRFELKSAQAMSYPATLNVKVSHATDKAKDRDFVLTYQSDNLYTGKFTLDPLPAKYYLDISNDDHSTAKIEAGSWRLTHSQKLPAQNVAFLPLTAFDDERQALPDQRDKRHQQHTPDTIPPLAQ